MHTAVLDTIFPIKLFPKLDQNSVIRGYKRTNLWCHLWSDNTTTRTLENSDNDPINDRKWSGMSLYSLNVFGNIRNRILQIGNVARDRPMWQEKSWSGKKVSKSTYFPINVFPVTFRQRKKVWCLTRHKWCSLSGRIRDLELG